MGKRGPKPTPTALLQLRGSWHARTAARKAEPQYKGAAPRKPRGMGRVAAAEWDRVVKHLEQHGLVKDVDRTALEAYCTWYEQHRRLQTALRRKKIGSIEYTRTLSAMSTAFANMMKAMACFGMTPADRSRVQEGKREEPQDPFGEFVAKGHQAAPKAG